MRIKLITVSPILIHGHSMSASLEHQLLRAALLCGLKPGEPSIYRLQLFFVANRDLGSKSHQCDFQRALETAVDKKGLFDNHEFRGSGEYTITTRGFEQARSQIGSIQPKYKPVPKAEFQATMRGIVGRTLVEVLTRGKKSVVYLDGERVHSAREACRRLEESAGVSLPTQGDSAVRVLQDLAVDRSFEIEFK
jgi:hypothetical protein